VSSEDIDDPAGAENITSETETEITAAEAEHNNRLTSMDEEMKKLMEALVDKEADLHAMENTITEDQYKALESEYEKLQREHATLLKEIEKGSHHENRALQQKVKNLEKQMKEAKKKQEDYQRLQALKCRGDLKLKEVGEEMEELKRKRVMLERKRREESDKFRDWKTERSKEVAQLRRNASKQSYEMQKLAGAKRKAEMILKRKTEEVANANRRLKEMTEQLSRKKIRRPKTSGSGISGDSSKAGLPAMKNPKERRQWLEEEAALNLSLKHAKETLEAETKARSFKLTEISMLKPNVARCREREGASENVLRLEADLAEREAEVQEKDQLIVKLQKEMAGTEDIQSASKRWESVRQLDDAKTYLRSQFAMTCNLMDERDKIQAQLVEAQEQAVVEKAKLMQQLNDASGGGEPEDQEQQDFREANRVLEDASKWLELENANVKAQLEEAIAEKNKLATKLEAEQQQQDSSIGQSADMLNEMLSFEKKYNALEKQHSTMEKQHSQMKQENYELKKQLSTKAAKEKAKPAWNVGGKPKALLPSSGEQNGIPTKVEILKKPPLPAEAKARPAGSHVTEYYESEDVESEISEEELSSESDSDSDFGDTPEKKKGAKGRKGKPVNLSEKAGPKPMEKAAVPDKENVVVKDAQDVEVEVDDETQQKRDWILKFKADELRRFLRTHGLPYSGAKPKMCERIISSDSVDALCAFLEGTNNEDEEVEDKDEPAETDSEKGTPVTCPATDDSSISTAHSGGAIITSRIQSDKKRKLFTPQRSALTEMDPNDRNGNQDNAAKQSPLRASIHTTPLLAE